ncbi:MAG TPA: deoxyribodipyrimidine photo-lyase [Reyranella sp.]|nr:deoxyribodipyrimidine photo-lyase [Reyranella sp.]
MPCSIVWFRNDLRLADNPALIAGLGSGRAVVPLYVLDEETEGVRPPGAASRWWLHHSLNALDASLRALGSRLIVRRGPAERVVAEFAAEMDAQAVYWNRVYGQGSRERDARLKQAFVARGVSAESLNRLETFLDGALASYREARQLPSVEGTSRLSPHLAFGEISPRQVWGVAGARGFSAATDKFLAELGWREFAYSLLFHFGDLAQRNFRPEFDAFPWSDEDDTVEAWRRGRTGYPIVDAGWQWVTGSGADVARGRVIDVFRNLKRSA